MDKDKELKVTKSTLNLATGKITTIEVTGKELDEWKKAHGIKTEEEKDDNTGI